MSAGVREGWIAGLVIGVLAGLIFLGVPPLALVLAAVFAVIVGPKGPRLAAAGGFGVGAGAAILALLVRGSVACDAFDAVAGQDCVAPDLAPWLLGGGVAIAAGFVATIVALRRRRDG